MNASSEAAVQEEKKHGLLTMDMAKTVAGLFRSGFTRVQDVLVFGSVARSHVGNDLDLIIVVNQAAFERYVDLMKTGGWSAGYRLHLNKNASVFRDRHGRFQTIEFLLGWDTNSDDDFRGWRQLEKEVNALGLEWSPKKFDLHIFPPNWRATLLLLQLRLGHTDPKFMETVAREAVSL